MAKPKTFDPGFVNPDSLPPINNDSETVEGLTVEPAPPEITKKVPVKIEENPALKSSSKFNARALFLVLLAMLVAGVFFYLLPKFKVGNKVSNQGQVLISAPPLPSLPALPQSPSAKTDSPEDSKIKRDINSIAVSVLAYSNSNSSFPNSLNNLDNSSSLPKKSDGTDYGYAKCDDGKSVILFGKLSAGDTYYIWSSITGGSFEVTLKKAPDSSCKF